MELESPRTLDHRLVLCCIQRGPLISAAALSPIFSPQPTLMPPASSTPTNFRNDINGLRAWAVVAVILFHFGVSGFDGGFVGVDIFFVISGFLMTGIVVGGLESGRFSLIDFYLARARRILPALMGLCAALLVLGWWALLPPDYKILGMHSAFSLAFLSNIKFWREAGYFDAASHEKWLLHTWSLAVEWQFYLLLPLILLAVWKWRPGRRSVFIVVISGILASLALSIFLTSIRPSAAFYLLPTRAWEMLAGGLVYLSANRWALTNQQRTAIEWLGIALLIASIVGFDNSSPWPGSLALIPVIGTGAILLSAQTSSLWTGSSVAQWFGTRSYSLYLWHWPIAVALTYLNWQTDAAAIFSGLVLTLFLGEASFRLIETPARIYLSRSSRNGGLSAITGAVVGLASIGIAISLMQGISGRFPKAAELAANEANNKNPRQIECNAKADIQSPSCVYGGSNLRAILIGDSHAESMTTALAAALKDKKDGIMTWTYSGCPTLQGAKKFISKNEYDEKCSDFTSWVNNQLATIPKNIPLVIVNRTSVYAIGRNEAEGNATGKPAIFFKEPLNTATPESLSEFSQAFTKTVCTLSKDRPVYLVRPTPEMGVNVPKTISRSLAIGNEKEISISLDDYKNRHSFAWKVQDIAHDLCGAKVLNPLPYLCQDGRCSGTKNGRPIYFDDNHLSEFGNKLLVPMFQEIFETTPSQLSTKNSKIQPSQI